MFRFFFLGSIFLVIFAFIIISTTDWSTSLPIRIGYFANKISTEEFSLEELQELHVHTKNCFTYLLENPKNGSVEIQISAGRSTKIKNVLDNSILTATIDSEMSAVQ